MEKEYKEKGGRAYATYSRLVKAGNRNYYIDAKEDSRGSRYIVLSEVKTKDAEGHAERHRIFIYEEDFARFSEALLDVIQSVGGDLIAGDEPTFPRLIEEEDLELSEQDENSLEPLKIDSIKLDW